MEDSSTSPRTDRPVRRFLGNPRAFLADSAFLPLVWLSYILPGRSRYEPWAKLTDRPVPGTGGFGHDEARHIVTLSRRLSLKPSLAAFFQGWPEWLWGREVSSHDLVVGWGYRPSGRKALSRSRSVGAETCLVEDGFLRSVERAGPEIGVNIDKTGIYYDARSPSRLFDLISMPRDESERQRARKLAATWRDAGLSKYNSGRPYGGFVPDTYVLVIDQVRNDLSIGYGLADQSTFRSMFDEALSHGEGASVVVKVHPDARGQSDKSHFDLDELESDPRVHLISDDSHVASLLEGASAVYTVTSQVGFEALLHGKRVECFGMPFYAGWGLTHDRLPRPENREPVDLDQLVAAALVEYPRYWNPVSQREAPPEEAFALVAHNIRLRNTLPRTIHAVGFSRWKRRFITQFLSGSEVIFSNELDNVPSGATVLLWGQRPIPDGRPDLRPLRIEDGFLRSSGLGANLVRPLSLVIDDLGIYYDASQPSRLEHILATRDYDDEERLRAEQLRERIVASRLNKYNLGGRSWERPATDREVLLVVGQVEEDASIQFGSPDLKTNEALLRRVREENPDAYIVYKPHPDVLAGLRKAGTDLTAGDMPYDELAEDVEPTSLLDSVDRLHTMTSLMGFEALMRGLPVTCHGLPFYAGWGLTDDRLVCERRGRKRTIDELVHAALIDYPRYFSPRGRMFARPEDILVELADLARAGPARRSMPRRVLYWLVTRWVKLRGRK